MIFFVSDFSIRYFLLNEIINYKFIIMKNQLKVGSVVGIFRTGMVGEVIEILNKEAQTRYHVKVPSEGETYSYSKQDLHLFPALGQKNIRDEWQQEHEENPNQPDEEAGASKVQSEAIHNRYANFLERIKFVMKIMVFTFFTGSLTIPITFAQHTADFPQGQGYDKIGKFENKRARVSLNGLRGIIDLDGNEVLAPKYEKIGVFKNRRARVMVNKHWGIVDWDGKEIIPPVYNKIGYFKNERAKILKDGRWGIIHWNGKEIVPPKYEKIMDFEDGRAMVMINDLWGIIDMNGKEIVTPKYHKIKKFENKRSKVYLNGRWGLIGWEGQEIVKVE